MIAIVCGGRDYTDAARVQKILDAAVDRLGLHTIIEGECPTEVNADVLARQWAEARGDVACIGVKAETVNGKFQGPARNQLMLTMLLRVDDEKAIIAFPGGTGTAHMIKIGRAADVRIIEVDRKPKVFNRHHGRIPDGAVYVGRGSPWGNPFEIGKDGDRDQVCDKFESEVLPALDVSQLRGKDLVCYCAPARCHADALLREANK